MRHLLHRGHALQFDGNWGREPVDFHRRPARLVVLEILRVQAVEGLEVSVHVYEKDGDVDELFPAASARLEDGLDVGEDTVDLSFKVKSLEVAVVVQFQSWNATIIGVAACRSRTDAAQEQEVAYAASVGVEADGFGGVGGGNAFAHAAKVARAVPSGHAVPKTSL